MALFSAEKSIDPCRLLGIQIDDDGNVTRLDRIPVVPPSQTQTPTDGILTTDATLDSSTALTARIFQPAKHDGAPLPVVLYFHGGGFALYSPSHIMFHTFCTAVAKAANAIVVSVDYRLAPNHRLPAAYDDAATAVNWLHSQPLDPATKTSRFFESPLDLSRVYLMGDSSGANIVYNLALRLSDTCPVHVAGLVMVQPFFGGIRRTASELRRERDRVIPLVANDLLWSLALPENADRDNHFCNFLNCPDLEGCLRGFPPVFVAVEGLDPLVDRQLQFVKILQDHGVHVEVRSDPEGYHGVQLNNVQKGASLIKDVCKFMSTSAAAASSSL